MLEQAQRVTKESLNTESSHNNAQTVSESQKLKTPKTLFLDNESFSSLAQKLSKNITELEIEKILNTVKRLILDKNDTFDPSLAQALFNIFYKQDLSLSLQIQIYETLYLYETSFKGTNTSSHFKSEEILKSMSSVVFKTLQIYSKSYKKFQTFVTEGLGKRSLAPFFNQEKSLRFIANYLSSNLIPILERDQVSEEIYNAFGTFLTRKDNKDTTRILFYKSNDALVGLGFGHLINYTLKPYSLKGRFTLQELRYLYESIGLSWQKSELLIEKIKEKPQSVEALFNQDKLDSSLFIKNLSLVIEANNENHGPQTAQENSLAFKKALFSKTNKEEKSLYEQIIYRSSYKDQRFEFFKNLYIDLQLKNILMRNNEDLNLFFKPILENAQSIFDIYHTGLDLFLEFLKTLSQSEEAQNFLINSFFRHQNSLYPQLISNNSPFLYARPKKTVELYVQIKSLALKNSQANDTEFLKNIDLDFANIILQAIASGVLKENFLPDLISRLQKENFQELESLEKVIKQRNTIESKTSSFSCLKSIGQVVLGVFGIK